VGPISEEGSVVRLQLVERDGRMCTKKVDEKAGTITYEAQCNFTLHSYDAEYCFVGDTDRLGFSKVTCLRIMEEKDGEPPRTKIFTLRIEDENRTPILNGVRYFYVETLLQMGTITTQTHLLAAFSKFHPLLQIGDLTPGHVRSWFIEQPDPEIKRCITYFGRQTDNAFVSGNVVMKDGLMRALSESMWHIVPHYFMESTQPLPRECFPSHIIIPQTHVRYYFLCDLWNFKMPAVFQNNLIPAIAALALSVANFYRSKLGKVPVAWLVGERGSTKTMILELIAAIQGCGSNTLMAGSSSNPALYDRAHYQRDLPVLIDDWVPPEWKDANSNKLSHVIRQAFDVISRYVSNKIRLSRSGFMYTVRHLATPTSHPPSLHHRQAEHPRATTPMASHSRRTRPPGFDRKSPAADATSPAASTALASLRS
jgi:hypothetical protein